MPIKIRIPIRRLSQPEFSEISYEVMRYTFAIHNEIGRFFEEKIYKRELAHRMPGVRLEEPIEIAFGSFHKTLFIDVLVGGGAIFEFKAVDSFTGRHRAQLIQYLMLADVAHGKLINVRPEVVDHEFVNTQWMHQERTLFQVETTRWNSALAGAVQFHDFLAGLMRDLGTGLGIELYEEAVEHYFGGEDQVDAEVSVNIEGHSLGRQLFRLIAPGIAFKITGLDGNLEHFENHARKLLTHVELRAIAWVNVTMKKVTFVTLER